MGVAIIIISKYLCYHYYNDGFLEALSIYYKGLVGVHKVVLINELKNNNNNLHEFKNKIKVFGVG
jgi:uncharacterized protein (DUF2164 family)